MNQCWWHQEFPTQLSGLAYYKILQVERKALALKRYYSVLVASGQWRGDFSLGFSVSGNKKQLDIHIKICI